MKSRIALALLVPTLFGPVAFASQNACMFEGGQPPQYYEIEFIGYGDTRPVIAFSSTAFGSGRRITLPPNHYSLEAFDPKSAQVRLEFHNSGDDSLPATFSLRGRSGRAQLKLGSVIVDGSLQCGQ